MKLRIITVVTAATSAWSLLRGQLAWLRQQGHQVKLVTSPGDVFAATLEREGVDGVALTMEREISPIKDLISLKRLISVFSREKPDVINVSTPKAGLLGGIAGVMTSVPVRIYTLRGLRMETSQGVKRSVLWLAEWIACACAHKVICVSPSLRDRAIVLRLVSSQKAVVLGGGSSNGVIAERFESTPERDAQAQVIRQNLGIPLDSFVFGFVGRFTRDKGILELLQAFELVSDQFSQARLLLVGDFETGDPIPETARKKIEQHPKIVRSGFVQDTAPYYHVLDVLVLPSYREGFPNVPLEAASAAKAVITTDATGARDAVIAHVTGLIVSVGDSTSLAEAMTQLLSQPELSASYGRAGRERVLREFTPEVIWLALQDLFTTQLLQRFKASVSQNFVFQKRLFDLAVTSILFVALFPLVICLAIAVRINLGPNVLFKQVRPGKNSLLFTMYKFRSMRDTTNHEGNLLSDAQRLTPFGRFLRSSSMDELPGLWNVLRGDMSLVGPRPLLPQYLERYTLEQARRHEVKPGITGWAQVNGRNAISWEEKFAFDVWYVDHQSFWLDVQILYLTVLKVFKREGVSAVGDATMPEFVGLGLDAGNVNEIV